jgi:alpha-amylase
MDYEAFGNHMWADSGIFDFIEWLPREVAKHHSLEWVNATEAVERLQPVGTLHVPPFKTISWADAERDTSAWLGNPMQRWAFEEIKRLGPQVLSSEDPTLIRIWRQLQTSDHLYYLSNKSDSDQDVHQYFSIYRTPTEGFVRVQSALGALASYLERHEPAKA